MTVEHHPSQHTAQFWRARIGALTSRGEVSGPRIDHAQAALRWWRIRKVLAKEYELSDLQADLLMADIANGVDLIKAASGQ